MTEGWIKIHRKIIDWQWFKDTNVFVTFLQLLLRANISDVKDGIEIVHRGEIKTTLPQLCEFTGLTNSQIRTSLDKLKLSREIAVRVANKYRIITICKFEDYQCDEINQSQAESQTNRRQIADKSQTKQEEKEVSPNNIYNNPLQEKEEKEKKNIISSSNEDSSEQSSSTIAIKYSDIVSLWNSICGECFGKVQKLTESRKQKIKVRISEFPKDRDYVLYFSEIFQKMIESDFFKNRWKPSFDWVIENDKNYLKVIEGNYDNRQNEQQYGNIFWNGNCQRTVSRRDQRIMDERAGIADVARVIEERSRKSYDGTL